MRIFRRALSVLAVATLPLMALGLGGLGCGADTGEQSDAVTQMSDYEVNFAKANAIWPDEVPIAKLSDMWTALVKVGDQTLPAPTHLFGEVINVIPYSNEDGVNDAQGQLFKYGDQEIAKVFQPGEIGIGLKMHRPEKRMVDLNSADAAGMKEDFKLQDTHIEIVVGVEMAEHGQPGAITLNNPQTYENGRFGNPTYSMIFLRPLYPDYAASRAAQYESNVRLALVGFNAATEFPGDYNGGDPLGARDPDRVREYVDQMVRAIAGDQAAYDWFRDDANMVYCAELAFIALNAGILQPLNATTMVPRVGQEVWDAFVAEVEQHNKGVDEFKATGNVSPENVSRFVELNDNKRAQLIRIELAPEDLAPMPTLAPNPAEASGMLALVPMTMSDIVEQFMRTHIPREVLGEALAPVQGAVLGKMKPGLLETMGMDRLSPDDPNRLAVEALFDQIVTVVGTSYPSYAAFREAISPYLAQARQVTGPRGDTGEGLFTPPSLFHVAAQGKHLGLLGMQYEGHGVHVSAVQKKADADPAPTPVDRIADDVSCAASCGAQAPGGCWCDATCAEYGDCCADRQQVCGG